MRKSSINGPFPMAMLNNQRIILLWMGSRRKGRDRGTVGWFLGHFSDREPWSYQSFAILELNPIIAYYIYIYICIYIYIYGLNSVETYGVKNNFFAFLSLGLSPKTWRQRAVAALEPWIFLTFHSVGVSSSQLTFTPWFFRVGWNHQPVNIPSGKLT